jgi:hypothetical protein
MYAGQDEADTEDLVGRAAYISLVNLTYGLTAELRLDPIRTQTNTRRVLKEVAEHFAALPPAVTEFDHFRPAAYLLENRSEVLRTLPEVEAALDRFEKLFWDLNVLLAGEVKPTARAARA